MHKELSRRLWTPARILPLCLSAILAGCGGGSGSDGGQNAASTAVTTSADAAASVGTTQAATAATQKYSVLAWNDLGMHCMDGKDYSIMSILPPYNNLRAQVVNVSTGKQATSGVTLTYEALADPSGSINTVSSTKTNFWQYVSSLYGASPKADRGLNLSSTTISNPVPSKTPAAMSYNATQKWFEAEGIPLTPYDDNLKKNYYPMTKVVAKDASGNVLASTQTVLPVSDEMSCKNCHASNASAAARPPVKGWANYTADVEKDWKKNILRLHDDKHANDAVYQAALAKLSPSGSGANGLAARAEAGTPTLCASCHGSNALNSPGYTVTVNGKSVTISAMTAAMHSKHSSVTDPSTQLKLDAVGNRNACYSCHPGSETKCLRGAMSNISGVECQSCHGSMAAVGQSSRVGWLQEPNCQSCHHDGKRETVAVTSQSTGALRAVTDTRFATNANTPKTGYSLYRFSTGHGSMQCEACHGPTHAEYSADNTAWSSSHDNDNLQSKQLQGHAGVIIECTVCHATAPMTTTGGPHGMHTVGQSWVSGHGDRVENATSGCTACHGSDYRGTPLSEAKADRSFKIEGKTISLKAGTAIGCYTCHNGPKP